LLAKVLLLFYPSTGEVAYHIDFVASYSALLKHFEMFFFGFPFLSAHPTSGASTAQSFGFCFHTLTLD